MIKEPPKLDSRKPLSALLSQILVAFTVEFDNEFERQMNDAGYPGARLSLVVWSNLLRFVSREGISIRDLASQSLLEPSQITFMLGGLERWGFVTLQPGSASGNKSFRTKRRTKGSLRRDGWGSGRGLASDWVVRLTSTRGSKARQIWLPLFGVIESRWRKHFGINEIRELRDYLASIVDKLEWDLPHGFADVRERSRDFPPRRAQNTSQLPLPTLLGQTLLTFAIDFERESRAPFALCANAIRVLGERPIRESEIARLTGSSPETSGIGWQLKPYIIVESDSKARGKFVCLSPRGLAAQQNYRRLTSEIETRWQARFGKNNISALRQSLESLLSAEQGERLSLSEALVPPPGTVRAGSMVPALGRRNVGAAAKRRARDLVAQTEAFVRDPAGTLPHYPLWDMNRGFGP